jgi:oxaloacetate decarboxylase alpha subunit/pyruvate carboxylase subunit B
MEIPYDTSSYKQQPNPVFPEYNDHKLAENEKDELLLELFPNVAAPFLRKKLEDTFGKEIEDERHRQEEAQLKAKLEYDSLSPEQRKERLLEGLYTYSWFSFMDNNDDDNETSIEETDTNEPDNK